jgi:TRAP-type C4-dicarboxylate transport system permease small subunit
MWPKRLARYGEKGVTGIARWFYYIAAVLLVVLMSLTVAEVISRYGFNKPIKGSYELIEYFMGIAVTFVMAYVMVKDTHIRITVLTSKFSHRFQAAFESLAYFFGMATFGVVTWQMFLYSQELRMKAQATEVLFVPVSPFVLAATIAWAVFALVCLVKLVRTIVGELKK